MKSCLGAVTRRVFRRWRLLLRIYDLRLRKACIRFACNKYWPQALATNPAGIGSVGASAAIEISAFEIQPTNGAAAIAYE